MLVILIGVAAVPGDDGHVGPRLCGCVAVPLRCTAAAVYSQPGGLPGGTLIDRDGTVAEPDARLSELTARMEQLGVDDPAGWARSEITENIAQQARYLFLRHLWPEAIDGWRDPAVLSRVSATARMLEQGANPDDLSRAMRLAAYEAVFTVLSILDEGFDPDAPEGAPGWRLMETGPPSDQLTGRDVGGLHEDVLSLDPSGREGSDLFDT